MGTLESPEVVDAFGKVVHCAMARGRSQAMEDLHEAKLLKKFLGTALQLMMNCCKQWRG